MTKNLRKYIGIFLIFTMFFSLASCKGAGEVVDRDTDVSDNENEADIPDVVPVDEDDPLYANSPLAAKNVYEVIRIDSPNDNIHTMTYTEIMLTILNFTNMP